MSIMLQRRGALLLGLLAGLAIISGADAQTAKYKEPTALAEQVKPGKLPPVEQRLPGSRWSSRSSSGPASTAACGAAPSSAPPTPTTTCGSSTTRSPLLAGRRQDRAEDRGRAGSRRRLQGLDDQAPQGRALVRRRAVHRRRHRVLAQGRHPEQGPDAGHPGWLRNADGTAGVGREGRTPDGPLHVQAAGDALPDRARATRTAATAPTPPSCPPTT